MTTNNQSSFTITTDSSLLDIPVRQIKEQERNNQQPDDRSTKSTSNTNITQPFPTQYTSPRDYEPPPIPSQYFTHSTPHSSPQQGSSKAPVADTYQNPPQVQFQTSIPTRHPPHQTLSFTPAQTS